MAVNVLTLTFVHFSLLRDFRDVVVGMATCYGLDGPGFEERCWGSDFRTRTDRL